MATVKTIGTGKDYTTLQTWEDWADDQVSADQWAECYGGADLGPVTISGWTATPSASLYPRIYSESTQPTNRHTSYTSQRGAYLRHGDGERGIYVQEEYVRIEWMTIWTETSTTPLAMIEATSAANHLRVDSCMFQPVAAVPQGILVNEAEPVEIWNNIIALGSTMTAFTGIELNYTGGDSAKSLSVKNNAVAKINSASNYDVGIKSTNSGGTRSVSDGFENNLVLGADTCFSHTGWSSVEMNNNLSEDGTADDYGGSNNLVNQDEDEVYQKDSVYYEWGLAENSPARNAGKTLTEFSTDGAWAASRPYGSAWCIGPVEFSPIVSTIGTGKDYTTIQAWENWADDQVKGHQWAECYAKRHEDSFTEREHTPKFEE